MPKHIQIGDVTANKIFTTDSSAEVSNGLAYIQSTVDLGGGIHVYFDYIAPSDWSTTINPLFGFIDLTEVGLKKFVLLSTNGSSGDPAAGGAIFVSDGVNLLMSVTDDGVGLAVPLTYTAGTPGLGKVLTSDAAGLASWSTPTGGTVDSVVDGTGLDVDNTDPANPILSLNAASIASLGLADTSTQPGDNISTLTNDSNYIASGDFISSLTNDSGYITTSSTNTLTNKTIDANGTGNSISNLETADFASGVIDTDLTSVSSGDATLPSAKATKTYADTKLAKSGGTVTGNVTIDGILTLDRADNTTAIYVNQTSTAESVTWRYGFYKTGDNNFILHRSGNTTEVLQARSADNYIELGFGLDLDYSTADRIAIIDSSKHLVSASTATYPSLTELSYVKGVTSAVQTQLNTAPVISSGTTTPASTPGKIGDIYVDTSAKKLYFATGAASSADWTIAN